MIDDPNCGGRAFTGALFFTWVLVLAPLFYNGSLSNESLRYGALIGLGGTFLVAYIFRVIDKRRAKNNKW
ncbi:MAG: hypothetical protein IPK17_14220 [Chloroflexi bacterium]|uniref:hypothetical protein n=1 Tax=Candidatus Flexifilum breve TaxID=3140694 RepID=UPI0031346DE8|nr:hypothetical protein [Chloroflexota bacterium]